MNEKPNFFVTLCDYIKVIFVTLSTLYIVAYFFYITNNLNLISFISPIIDPFANFTSGFFTHSVEHNGRIFSMQYIICAVFMLFFSFLTGKLSSFFDILGENLDYTKKLFRMRSDHTYSKIVAKDFKKTVLKTGNFLVLLKLDLVKRTVDFTSERRGFSEIADKNYQEIIDAFVEDSENLSLKIENRQLILISKKFKDFDEIFSKFLQVLNSIADSNAQADIVTNVCFILDIVKGTELSDEEKELISKILKFNYKNKIIATTLFSQRYSAELDGKFTFSSMGNIRIFENEDISKIPRNDFDISEDEYESLQKYSDLELFVLSRKKKRR